MEKNNYRINLTCWEPEYVTSKNKEPGLLESSGGSVKYGSYMDDDQAKQAARESWKENFPDTMKEIVIYDQEGKEIFRHNNFKDYDTTLQTR